MRPRQAIYELLYETWATLGLV